MTDDNSSRRDLLCGLAAGATLGVAGCIDGVTGPSGSTGNGGFKRVTVEGTTLVVEIQSTNGVDTVNVIAPDGSLYAERSVSTGATKLEFDLGYDYPPGEYEITAVQGDSTTAPTSYRIAPKIRITGFGMGANHMEKMPDSLGNTEEFEAFVSVENTGTGPEAIDQLLILGGVPNPTVDLRESDASGIFDAEDGEGTRKYVPLLSGEAKTLFTSTLPFYQNGESKCDPRTTECRIKLRARSAQREYSSTFSLEYVEGSHNNGCQIKVLRKK